MIRCNNHGTEERKQQQTNKKHFTQEVTKYILCPIIITLHVTNIQSFTSIHTTTTKNIEGNTLCLTFPVSLLPQNAVTPITTVEKQVKLNGACHLIAKFERQLPGILPG